MSIRDEDRIDDLRQRLYQRGNDGTLKQSLYELKDEETPVANEWQEPPKPIEIVPEPSSDTLVTVKKKRGYRLKLVLIALVFFVLSVAASSFFLFYGNSAISGDNIAIAVTGPFTVGGGESIALQIGVINNNEVPIKSATLIVEYPDGTRSVNEDGKELFTERLSLETVASGETLNIPLRVLVFGEENEEKEVKVSVEYRVEGSNALFFKEAEAFRFKISSSPVLIKTQNTIKISSGQETEMKLIITSNSPTPMAEVLVKASYPSSFDFSESNPKPDYAEHMWLIRDLEPESSQIITIKGVVVGRETDEYSINLSVGVPGDRNPQDLASIFVTDRIDFVIERPFIDIELSLNGSPLAEAAIEPGAEARGEILILNTLEETIYDTKIIADFSGNALSEIDIESADGYYNSSNNTLTWDVGNFDQLEQITPGKDVSVNFTIKPDENVKQTPQIDVKVRVEGRRVSENNVAEKLEGTAEGVIKVISVPKLTSDVGFNNSVFTDTGYIPPVAEEETTYTVSLRVENSSNDITDTVVTTSVPPYVEWLGQKSGSGVLDFNNVNRILTWTLGEVDANSSAFVSFQVKILPSVSLIGKTPTLVGSQRLKATDRFTGTVVRDDASALTTELSFDYGYGDDNGRVVAEPE